MKCAESLVCVLKKCALSVIRFRICICVSLHIHFLNFFEFCEFSNFRICEIFDSWIFGPVVALVQFWVALEGSGRSGSGEAGAPERGPKGREGLGELLWKIPLSQLEKWRNSMIKLLTL